METEIRVLRFLMENGMRGGKGITIRGISRGTGADYRIVNLAVNRLAGKAIVAKRVVGKAADISLTNRFSHEVFQAELQRREEFLRDKGMAVMLDTIKQNIRSVHYVLLLFGSYAKKRQTRHSDIDLMFVVPDKAQLDSQISRAVSLLPLRIHDIMFEETEFIQMKNSREFTVVSEAIKNNIILYGIEQYYELIK